MSQFLHKFDASRLLITAIDSLLAAHNLTRSQLNFIAVNQGPGPFTTLRTVLSTVNGLAYALSVPLIGVDGLAAFADEVYTGGVTAVMLNAFNHDLYFALKIGDTIVDRGCKNGAMLIAQLKSALSGKPIFCVGNRVELWRSALEAELSGQLIIPDPMPQTVSIKQVAAVAQRQWQEGVPGSTSLMPTYLKAHSSSLRCGATSSG